MRPTMPRLPSRPPCAAAAAPTGPTRRAFILGVERYSDPQIQRLTRSDSDATDIAADLEQLGFDRKNITLATDLRAKADFDKRFDAFLATVQEGDFVFFFFSGHGIGVEAAGHQLSAVRRSEEPFHLHARQAARSRAAPAGDHLAAHALFRRRL